MKYYISQNDFRFHRLKRLDFDDGCRAFTCFIIYGPLGGHRNFRGFLKMADIIRRILDLLTLTSTNIINFEEIDSQ